ncbi:MAG: M48 family metallopeptidase [Candidatus Omnitrophica bacterium]|nr:M48 family metallopeptidase [Candidatus Omnitrophota bacterium]
MENSHQKAREYQKIKNRLLFVHLFGTPLFLLIAMLTPVSAFFRDGALVLTDNPYLGFVCYFFFFSLYMLVFDFPFSYYSSYAVEHQFQLSNQTWRAWLVEWFKKALLSFGLSCALLLGLYALIWNFPRTWWLLAWVAYAFVSYVLGKIFPVVIVPLFYRYGKVEDDALKKRVVSLCERFRLPVENVFSINLSKTTKKANAAFMGLGKTKRVVLSDTLLDNFNHDEIDVVVAHELAHYRHHDIWKQFAIGVVTSLVAFWITFMMLGPLAIRLNFEGAADMASMPLLFLIFYLFHLILMPIQNGYSRHIERAADRFALEALQGPAFFISCMEKLGDMNLADPNPNPIMEWLFFDHPPLGKRIEMAKQWTGEK